MTATLASMLIVAGAAWIWTQLGVVKLPTPKWTMSIREGAFVASPGKAVELLGKGVNDGEFVKIGDAAITEWKQATKGHDLAIESVVMTEKHVTSEAVAIRIAGDQSGAMGVVEGRPVGVPIFQPVYLQAGGAGLVLVLGASLVFWQVGLKPRTVDFLIATDSEMKKVNWSTRREVMGITQVVIFAFFMIAGVIFVIDYLFSVFFGLIHVIRTAGGG
ncbi:MAG: preprotein translocase subunit SecE [Phycisphaerales bacterium]|nr:preprotein translocase subunit SecE [Phycisphaerales bacterium]